MKKMLVDILLFIFMLLEFSRGYLEPIWHEIFGTLLIVLVIIHLILNRTYLKNVFKGKYNFNRIIMFVVNLLFFITFILSLICGLLSSENLFRVLNIHSFNLIKYHKIFAYISLVFMGLHLGINFNGMFGKLTKKVNNKTVLYVIELVIVIYGVYSFIKLDFIKHITGIYGFSVIEGYIFLSILRYFGLVMMFAIITHNIYKLLKK